MVKAFASYKFVFYSTISSCKSLHLSSLFLILAFLLLVCSFRSTKTHFLDNEEHIVNKTIQYNSHSFMLVISRQMTTLCFNVILSWDVFVNAFLLTKIPFPNLSFIQILLWSIVVVDFLITASTKYFKN